MDIFDRRILGRLARQLPLRPGEQLLDFEIGATRPFCQLPPPFPADFGENARIEIAVSDQALYFRVKSRSYNGDSARLPWPTVAAFGAHRAPEGKWKRWSLRGRLDDGAEIQISLLGRPRPTMVANLAELVPPG